MTAPTVESVAALAGRELDRLVAVHVMGINVLGEARCTNYDGCWDVYGPVVDDDSGHVVRLVYAEHPDDPWAAPDYAGLNYPRLFGYTPLALGVVPEFSSDPAAFFAMMERVRENGWAYTMSERGGKCWVIIDRPVISDAGENGLKCLTFEQHKGDAGPNQLPLAFARAALLTTITPKGG